MKRPTYPNQNLKYNEKEKCPHFDMVNAYKEMSEDEKSRVKEVFKKTRLNGKKISLHSAIFSIYFFG